MRICSVFLLTFWCLGQITAAPVRPLGFEERQPTLFVAHSAGVPVKIAQGRVAVGDVTLRFLGGSAAARLEGVGPSAPSTYITSRGSATFPQFTRLAMRRLYSGVDVLFYGHENQLEYDLELAPGVSPSRARIAVDGARSLHIDEQGNLIIETRAGMLRQLAPRVFETRNRARRPVSARYVLLAKNKIGFRVGRHDRGLPLTIDPVLVYEKYFGGSALDSASAVATDSQGNVYVAGATNSVDFPITTGGFQSKLTPPLLALSNIGQTVTPMPVGDATSVEMIGGTPDGRHLYLATTSGIFVSHDGGTTFSQASALTSQPGSSAAVPLPPSAVTISSIAVDPVDPSRAFLATNLGLYGTQDNGQSWYFYDGGFTVGGSNGLNVGAVLISPVDHATLYATTTYPNHLYKSTDGAQTWQLLNPTSPGEQAQYIGDKITIALTPDGSDLYVVDPNDYLLKSSDGGATWQQLASGLSVARQITIDPSNPSRIYILDNDGVLRSTDGGQSFTKITPSDIQGAGGVVLGLDSSTGVLYLANYRQAEISTDQGTTWKPLGTFSGAQTMFGTSGRVLVGQGAPSVPFVVKWNAAGDRMLYSTFFGGSLSDFVNALTVDAQGEAIFAGAAYSPDFPVTKTVSGPSPAGMANGFVAKLSADGSHMVYSTIFGASKGAAVNGLAVDSSGALYVTGRTASPDYPTTSGTLQSKLPTAACTRNVNPLLILPGVGFYAFVSKFNADASALDFSTFLTGACGSAGQGIAVDSAGNAIIVGSTTSPDFPASSQGFQPSFPSSQDQNPNLNTLDVGFVTKLNAAGSQILASTFVGGGYETEANALALDSAGNVLVTGSTWGITPGATRGAYQTQVDNYCAPVISIGPSFGPYNGNDAFVLKLDSGLSTAQYLTYLGGGCSDVGNSIVLDSSGNSWVAGYTSSADFPLKSPYAGGGASSNFVSQLSADGSQSLFSSYSDGIALAADPAGKIYVAGTSYYLPGPKQTGSLATLAKLDPSDTPPVVIDSIGNSSPFPSPPGPPAPLYGGVAPGEMVQIHGRHLGPSQTVMAQLNDAGRLPLVVDATKVYFGPYLAPIISVQDSLIVCFVPFEVSGTASVTVDVDGQTSNAVRMGIPASNPQILAITNQDGTTNTADHPAPKGSVITLWVTGLGQTNPVSVDGMINVAPLPVPLAGLYVGIGNQQALPQFVASATGLVAGITQVNVQVPVATYSQNPTNVNVVTAQAPLYVGP
ncbi:MAG TPA: SBBP repeat-containing protein [Bryobacteraceae bacterium]|nr:SBBP repeat-containing protein [Bryobacteraceae bacterium]